MYKLQGDEIAYVEKETNKDDDKSSQVIYDRFHKEKRTKVLCCAIAPSSQKARRFKAELIKW